MGQEKANTINCPQILTADNYSILYFILFIQVFVNKKIKTQDNDTTYH